jgi:putative ABC transport system permease protein
MVWYEIRYSCRALVKARGFTAVTVLTLALGIGATTAIFSMVNGVLLRPLAYPEPERLVHLHEFIPAVAEKFPRLPVCARHFMEWRERCSSFESLSLIEPGTMNLTGKGEPERLEAVRVSANLFETLQVKPSLGRTFVADEEEAGRNRVAVISEGLWRRKLNADPSAMGTTITLDNEVYTVIGVLPGGFRFPNPNPFGIPDLTISSQPDAFTPKVFADWERNGLMGMFNFHVIARLKDRVTHQEARAELDVIAAQLVKMSGEDLELRAIVKPLKGAIVKDSQRGLLVVLSAIGSVLLIACLNLTILHLVRAERRSYESAIRIALGANRLELLRQALTETLLLTVLGATLGVVIASAGLGTLIRIAPEDIPRLDQVRIDSTVLLFVLVLMGVTTLLCGLIPAWRTARSNAEQVLKAGGPTATTSAGGLRLRSALVTVEVGLGVVLLITAGLLLSSFVRILRADKGFHAPTVLAADIAPSETKYDTWERKSDFHGRLLDHLASAPGIRSAAIVNALPLQGHTWVDGAWLPGDSRPSIERPTANVRFVSRDYFRTMGIPLLSGRTFNETDRTRRVAIISERVARTLWPNQDALGQRFARYENDLFEVIGVVKDVCADVDRGPVAMVYRPYWDGAPVQTVVVARAAGAPFSIAGSVREAIRSVDADLPISRMYTMREVLEVSVSQRRFQMLLASAFAVCALILAGLGIYGVVSYAVARRTREMGIRLAFGARPLDIYRIVLRRGMTPVALYEISPADPLTIVAVVTIVSLVAITACYTPARRAAQVDPTAALRYE